MIPSRPIVSAQGDLLSWLRPENVALAGPWLSESEDIQSWIKTTVTKREKEHGPIPKKDRLPHEIGEAGAKRVENESRNVSENTRVT